MFKLFGKKKEAPTPQAAAETPSPYKAFAAGFEPEELDLLAVTAPGSFGILRRDDSGLSEAGILLTAWMEEDSPDIHREPAFLVALGDQELLSVLRQRLPGNFILKFKARLSPDRKRLLLTNLPAPGFDPDLKAILEEQKAPVTFQAEDLGEFTLSRNMNWFQCDVDWDGQSVPLAFDQDEDREACLGTARALLADSALWDGRLREFAVDRLLEQANQQAQEEEGEELTGEQLLDWIALETILVGGDGRVEFWFNDGGLFMGSIVRVTGTLTGGLTDVQMEG